MSVTAPLNKVTRTLAAAAALALVSDLGFAQALTPDRAAFLALYKELVEINTTQSVGDCTVASNAMAAHLKAAGFPDSDVQVIVPPGHPKRGNLVARIPGTDPTRKAVLLLAHIDVVEADAKDWQRPPFQFIEENGMFWGRGVADDKAMAAIFADNFVRYKKEGYRPAREIKFALTCGEETPEDYNGVRYLLEHHRPLVDAGFVINENGSGVLNGRGEPVAITMQAGQRVRQLFTIAVSGSGGLSSGPPKDTPVTQLARAVARIQEHEFPLNLSASTRAYLDGMAKLSDAQTAADYRALLQNPPDASVAARMARSNPRINAMLRATCVAVRFAGGEHDSAVPQRATATIDCRMIPGESVDALEATLRRLIDDPKITLARTGDPALPTPPPPMTEEILGPARQAADKYWPGVPLIPYQVNGEDDGRFFAAAGIPTYGLSGLFQGPEPSGSHGLNEHIRVKSVYDARDFLFDVVKLYAGGR